MVKKTLTFLSSLIICLFLVSFDWLPQPVEPLLEPLFDLHLVTPLQEHTIRLNETLKSILLSKGSSMSEIHDLTQALKPLVSPRTFRTGQSMAFRFTEDKNLQLFQYKASPADIYEIIRIDEKFMATKLEIPIQIKKENIHIQLNHSLYEDLTKAGETPELIGLIVDILAWDVDFMIDPRQGDQVTLVVEKQYVEDVFYKYGRVLAINYQGDIIQQKAFYFEKTNNYYDEKGESLARNFLKSPVKYTRISSGFGRRRHPITHRHHKHLGTDYVAPRGTPVWAIASGRIIKKGYTKFNGNYLAIRHNKGFETYYLHLSRFKKGIKVRQKVKQKDVIAYVGSTGRSSGPHLHLSVKSRGRFINPLKLKRIKSSSLKGNDLILFENEISEYEI